MVIETRNITLPTKEAFVFPHTYHLTNRFCACFYCIHISYPQIARNFVYNPHWMWEEEYNWVEFADHS